MIRKYWSLQWYFVVGFNGLKVSPNRKIIFTVPFFTGTARELARALISVKIFFCLLAKGGRKFNDLSLHLKRQKNLKCPARFVRFDQM